MNRVLFLTARVLPSVLGTALFVLSSPLASAQCHKAGYCPTSYYTAGYHQLAPCQYYKSWSYAPQIQGYACYYCYKPYAAYQGYVNTVCVYYPDRYPTKVFYYDPGHKEYYGCYDYKAKGFSWIRPEDRHPSLSATPAEAFSPPGPLPKVGDLPAPRPPVGVAPPQVSEPTPLLAPPKPPVNGFPFDREPVSEPVVPAKETSPLEPAKPPISTPSLPITGPGAIPGPATPVGPETPVPNSTPEQNDAFPIAK